jgi:hypothetical protein
VSIPSTVYADQLGVVNRYGCGIGSRDAKNPSALPRGSAVARYAGRTGGPSGPSPRETHSMLPLIIVLIIVIVIAAVGIGLYNGLIS